MQLRNRINFSKSDEDDQQKQVRHLSDKQRLIKNVRKSKLFSSLADLFGNDQGYQIYQQARQYHIRYIEEIEEKGYEIVCVNKQMILQRKKKEASNGLDNDMMEQYVYDDLFDQNIKKYKEQLYYDMFLDKAHQFDKSKKDQNGKKTKKKHPDYQIEERNRSNIKQNHDKNSSRNLNSLKKDYLSNWQQKCINQSYLSNFNENEVQNQFEQVNQTPLISSFCHENSPYENGHRNNRQSDCESYQTHELSDQKSYQKDDFEVSQFNISKMEQKQQSNSSFTLSNFSFQIGESDHDQKNIKTKNINIKGKDSQDNLKDQSKSSQNQGFHEIIKQSDGNSNQIFNQNAQEAQNKPKKRDKLVEKQDQNFNKAQKRNQKNNQRNQSEIKQNQKLKLKSVQPSDAENTKSFGDVNNSNEKDQNTKLNQEIFQSQMSQFESFVFQKQNLTRNMYKKLKNSFLVEQQNVTPFDQSYSNESMINEKPKQIQKQCKHFPNKSQLILNNNSLSQIINQENLQKHQQKKDNNQRKQQNISQQQMEENNYNKVNQNVKKTTKDVVNLKNQQNLKDKKGDKRKQNCSLDEDQLNRKNIHNLSGSSIDLSDSENLIEKELSESAFSSPESNYTDSDSDYNYKKKYSIQNKKTLPQRKYKTNKKIKENANKILNNKEGTNAKKKYFKLQKQSKITSNDKVFSPSQKTDQVLIEEQSQDESPIVEFDLEQNIFQFYDDLFDKLQVEFIDKKDQQKQQEIIPITHSNSSLNSETLEKQSNQDQQYSPIAKLNNFKRPIPKKLKSKVLRKYPQINFTLKQQQPYLIQFKQPLQIYNASKWFSKV